MTVQIGELRARLTAEAQQMKSEIRAVKKDLSDLGDQGKKTGKEFDSLNGALQQLGLSADQIKKIETQMKNINPSRLEQGLHGIAEELRRMGVESKQVQKVTNELNELESESKKAKQGIEGIGTGLASLGAGVVAERLVSTIQSFTDEATTLARSYKGLSEVSKGLNQDMEKTAGLADELAERWGLNKAALADTVKTYLTAGLSLDQTRQIIIATADAAVYNREAHLGWDEAIKQVAQGVKMGNSDLTDAAGITTNLSVMQDRYAKSLGTTADKLTDAQKVQAAYNGIVSESAIFAGNADSAMKDYTGTQATFSQTLQTARVELGEAFIPALEELMTIVTPLIKEFSSWVDDNEDVVVGLAAAALAVTALIAVVGGLITAVTILQGVMGPIGWTLLAIGALVAGVSAYMIASSTASESVLKFAKSQGELNDKLNASPLKRTSQDVKNLQADIETLSGIMEKRNRLMDEYNRLDAKAKNGQGSAENTQAIFGIADQVKELDKQLKGLGYENVDEVTAAIKRMKDTVDRSIPALLELKRAELGDLASKVSQIDKTDELRRKYDQLSSAEKLSESQKSELASVVKQLKQEYPDLIAKLDEEGRFHITNKDAIYQVIDAERDAVRIKAELRKQELEDLKKSTEAKLKQAEIEVKSLEEVTKAQMKKDSPMSIQKFDESQIPSYITGTAREALIFQGKQMNEFATKQLQERTDSLNTLRTSLNEIKKMQQDLTVGNWDAFKPRSPFSNETPPGKGKDEDPQRKAFEEEIALIRYKTEMYNWSAEQQIAAFEKVKQNHKAYLTRSVEDERMVNLQIKQLNDAKSEDQIKQAEQTRKAEFDFSVAWIEREKYYKRLSLEDEYAAWERVQARYMEGSAERERAERELFRVRQEMDKRELDRVNEIEKQRTAMQKDVDDLISRQKKEIEEARRAELKAIEDARKAFVDAQDEKIRAIDRLMAAEDNANADSDYASDLAAKRARVNLLASAVGPEGKREREQLLKEIADMETDHQRDLRKRQLEAGKTALEDEKRTREVTFDEQKDAVETQYDDLLGALENYQDGVEGVENGIKAFRIASTKDTNAGILSDLDTFVEAYRQKMATVTSLSSQLTKQQDWAEYMSNTTEWYSTLDPNRKGELNKRNTELRSKYGIPEDNYDNLQHFSAGGVVAGIPGQPVPVIAHGGEVMLNSSQQSALFRLLDSSFPSISAAATTNNSQQVTNHYDLSVREVYLEDDADITSLYDERDSLVRRIQARSGEKTG